MRASPPPVQVVSERLSAHVMAHYAQFVDGIEEVTRVQADLQVGSARDRGRGRGESANEGAAEGLE